MSHVGDLQWFKEESDALKALRSAGVLGDDEYKAKMVEATNGFRPGVGKLENIVLPGYDKSPRKVKQGKKKKEPPPNNPDYNLDKNGILHSIHQTYKGGVERMDAMGYDIGVRSIGMERPGTKGKNAYQACTKHVDCKASCRLQLMKTAGGVFILCLDGANEHATEETETTHKGLMVAECDSSDPDTDIEEEWENQLEGNGDDTDPSAQDREREEVDGAEPSEPKPKPKPKAVKAKAKPAAGAKSRAKPAAAAKGSAEPTPAAATKPAAKGSAKGSPKGSDKGSDKSSAKGSAKGAAKGAAKERGLIELAAAKAAAAEAAEAAKAAEAKKKGKGAKAAAAGGTGKAGGDEELPGKRRKIAVNRYQ